jgi:excisionase family DNA binding protein
MIFEAASLTAEKAAAIAAILDGKPPEPKAPPAPPAPAPPRFVSPDECAAALKVHKDTVMRLIRSGRIRARKVGRQYRIPESEIHAFANE